MEAYPLSWPPGFPRARSRSSSAFKPRGFGQSRDELLAELSRMGASKVVLSTNVPLRGDGLPRADFERRIIRDPGVAVYFHWRGKPRVLACDRWLRLEENLRAITLTIEAMRGLERWGASDILERAFTGFTSLPAPEQWWDVLGVESSASLTLCERMYRERMIDAHPDRGGSHERASKLNWAIEQARIARKGAA